jgi:NAD(P) transhydrogenase
MARCSRAGVHDAAELIPKRYHREGRLGLDQSAGPPSLASVSMEQGRVAACYAMGISFKQTVDPLTPFGVYSIPECAMVGLSEQQAQEQGLDYEIGIAQFKDNTRAAIFGATEGMIKLVARRDDRRRL